MTDRLPHIDMAALDAGDEAALAELARGARDVGFFTLHNTALTEADVREVLEAYRAFFAVPKARKEAIDMARTGANRGWGAPGSEQVDPEANPDYKQVFDMGHEWPESGLRVYAPNLWPEGLPGFREALESYFEAARSVALDLLSHVARAVGRDPGHFRAAFGRPMALLRGNYYPQRPDWAGEKDFGIATHTDYGCLTLLAMDGTPGLEVRKRGGGWIPVTVAPGTFVINFGEMLQMWTSGEILATPHRVRGSTEERISVPLFFNPRFDTNVAPPGEPPIRAVDHLQKRFDETYLHLKRA